MRVLLLSPAFSFFVVPLPQSDNILKGMNFPELEQKYEVKNQQSFQH